MTADFTAAFREHAKKVGADLIGIAPVSRFEGMPAEKHPASIFPEVKSIIIVGKRITRGTLRGVEEGTQFDLYNLYGREWLNNRVLATATFRTAEFLEDNGWEAVPIPNLPPEIQPMGISVRPGQPAPNVMLDFNDAAVRAGLGEIGHCGMFLTSQFGHRQRFQMILTDAELSANDIPTDSICMKCSDLTAICPLKAITDNGKIISICGKSMPVADVDDNVCKRCKNGATANNLHPSGKVDRFAALCSRNCMTMLEDAGRLDTAFEHKFRDRKPWGVVEELKKL